MDAANFAADFTQLLMRYVVTPKSPNKKTEEASGPDATLTPAVVVEIVQESLRAVFSTSNLPNISENVYKTPSNDIVINTPDAPNVTRASFGIGNRVVSESTITEQVEASAQKKNPSPSKMQWSAVGRSGTFVHEDGNPISKDIKKSLGNSEIQVEINDDVFETSEKTSNDALQMKLDALRKCAADVIAKIDEVKGPSTAVQSKPIRRLSTLSTTRPYNCTENNPSIMRSIQPSKVRRSLTAFPGTTPTSSRLNTTAVVGENLSKRKSTSTASLHSTSTNFTMASSRLSLAPITVRSNTSMSLPNSKKSPNTDVKPPKNPKYAHIQSSIPKPSFGLKKKV